MRVQVDVNLTELHCIVPNESADEPYLWTFFLKLDGDTIRQIPGGGLVPSIVVHSVPGSHGNLGATGIGRGSVVAIPPALGTYSTTLRPIELTFLGRRIRVPGQIVVVAVVLEEDASPDDGIETGHQSLRVHIEQRVNDFVANLSQTELLGEAGERVPADVPEAERPAAVIAQIEPVVNERVDALVQELRDTAGQLIEVEVLSAHTLGAIWEFLDADEQVGAATPRFDQRDLLAGLGAGRRFIFEELADTKDGHVRALYRLIGTLATTVTGQNTDLAQTGSGVAATPAETGSHTFEQAQLCIEHGQRAEWTRLDQREEARFVLAAPFIPVTWSIDGRELTGPAGKLQVPGKICAFPFFDPNHPGRPSWRSEPRTIEIAFEILEQDGLPAVVLRNRPEDGSWYATLRATGMVGMATPVPLGTADFGFDGQAVESAFFEAYDACIDRYRSVGERYAKSTDVGPRDLWGPYARQRWYEEQVRIGERLVRAGSLPAERFEAAQRVLRSRLRLG